MRAGVSRPTFTCSFHLTNGLFAPMVAFQTSGTAFPKRSFIGAKANGLVGWVADIEYPLHRPLVRTQVGHSGEPVHFSKAGMNISVSSRGHGRIADASTPFCPAAALLDLLSHSNLPLGPGLPTVLQTEVRDGVGCPMDSYLEIARKVLGEARQPLNARQILKAAYQLHVVPRELYGRNQHKTLHARVATDILKQRSKSEFCRSGPGRFFLRSLLSDRTVPSEYRREYVAPLRASQLGRFDVLAFPRKEVARLASRCNFEIPLDGLMTLSWRYAQMEKLRRDARLIPFRFLIVIVDDGRAVLSHVHPRGDDHLAGQGVLGITGIVRREDRSLFSSDEAGLVDAAVRTLMQHLDLHRMLISALEEVARWSTPITLFDECEEAAIDDLITILPFRCSGIPEVVEAIDALAASEWHHLPIRINDLGRLERWSARVIGDVSLHNAVFS